MSERHFDVSWEDLYSKGRMLNRYPHDRVVSIAFKYFGSVKNRANVRILDLGCGAGNNSWFFAREGFDVTGIDASETAIKFARKRFESAGLKADFHCIRFDEIKKLDCKFDLILDREALYTLEWEDLTGIVCDIRDLMHDKSIFLSFFYNTHHPAKKYCKKTNNGRTFYDPEEGVFGGSRRVTLLDERSVFELFSKYEIIELHDHRIEPLIEPAGEHEGMSEFIVIARKSL